MHKAVISLYEPTVSCQNSVDQCPKTINYPQDGFAPRGFFTLGDSLDIAILIIAKNPGHPIGPEKKGLYQGKTPEELVRTVVGFARSVFDGSAVLEPEDRPSERFHQNLSRYLSYFLDVPKERAFEQCAFTNLVKCSSINERDNLHPKTVSECFQRHLARELEFYSPKVILALGREVESALKQRSHPKSMAIPILYIKHPSYYYRSDKEAEILASLKERIVHTLEQ